MIILHLTDVENFDVKPAYRERLADPNPIVARSARMMLELLEYLEADPSKATAFGYPMGAELLLSPAKLGDFDRLRIAVDSPDYGPRVDGLPIMHYRVNFDRSSRVLSRDERTRECSQVKSWICEAFAF